MDHAVPMIGMPGTTEMLIILAIIIFLFGAAKLPDLARSTGRSLRIFKAETKGLSDDEETESKDSEEPRSLTSGDESAAPAESPATAESADETAPRQNDN